MELGGLPVASIWARAASTICFIWIPSISSTWMQRKIHQKSRPRYHTRKQKKNPTKPHMLIIAIVVQVKHKKKEVNDVVDANDK